MLNRFTALEGTLPQQPIELGPRRFGLVRGCEGSLVEVSGLSIPVGSLCAIMHGGASGHKAEVIGFRNGRTLMSLLGDPVLLRPGAIVRPYGLPGMLRVGDRFLGRAVDGQGEPIDGGTPIFGTRHWPAKGHRMGALERSSIVRPFDCGIRAINALATLGIGQRVGLVAGSGVGKSVLMDMIARNAEADIVVMGLIGERGREVSDFVSRHMHGAAARRTAIVAVPADHAPNLHLRGAFLATCLAEYFREQGANVLLMLDSLTRIAHAAREIGVLLGESSSARGYPPSALATLTRLVERSGNSAQSGGSITGIYTVLADGDDHNNPVVDTARAILDGHIVLDREIAQRGRYPAISVPASLSRVIDDVAMPDHIRSARELRSLISSYESNRDLVLMGAYQPGRDPTLDRAMAKQGEIEAFLAQDREVRVALDEATSQMARLLADAG